MSNINLSTKSVTLNALQTQAVSVTGSFFYCTKATGPFVLSIDGGQEFDWQQGLKFNIGNQTYTKLIFRNTLNSPITINFYTSEGPVDYQSPPGPVLMQNAPTVAIGSGKLTLAAAGVQYFNGNANGSTLRKSIIVHNREQSVANGGTGYVIQILDGSGVILDELDPGQDWGLELSGPIAVKNPNAGPATFMAGEVYYAS